MSNIAPNTDFNQIFKQHWGQIVALLANHLKDIELAEDSVQDAVVSALHHWKNNGLPKNPQAWLFTTAKHKALDKIRRANSFSKKQIQYQQLLEVTAPTNNDPKENHYTIPDERLRLMFTCCHPALAPSIAIALTLRLLGGLTTEEIAKAFMQRTETMAQRIVRGKKKIKQATIPFVIPEKNDFDERLNTVLTVIYLIFNEGYYASSGKQTIRNDLCQEAIRLIEILIQLCPNQSEVNGLYALMLINDSRRPARFSSNGDFIPLENQDRSLWLEKQKNKGINLIQSTLKQKRIGSYQLQAVISAIHSEAKDYLSTNWQEIVLIYDELLKINPTNVIRLNRLVALSKISKTKDVLPLLDDLEKSLQNYHPFHSVKAEFLDEIGDKITAKESYQKAIDLSHNKQTNRFLKNKLINL